MTGHVAGGTGRPLTLPDDITAMGGDLFTAFQNGVGPQGQPSTDGNTDSTVVEFTPGGHVVQQWDIQGKCDGVTADPGANMLVATVNEDAGSSIYTISPAAATSAQVQHYRYNEPLPHLGGTDAVSVLDGKVIVSASAPGTTGQPAPHPTYPAAYTVSFDSSAHVATVSPLFYDEARATVANVGPISGKVVRLALTDPDSNAVVPASALRFGGDFELNQPGRPGADLRPALVGHGSTAPVGAAAVPGGRRHRVSDELGRRAVRLEHQRRHRRRDHRPVPGERHLRRRHPLRRGRRAADLPRPRLPAELPGHAQPVQRPRHPRAAVGRDVRAPRPAVHQPGEHERSLRYLVVAGPGCFASAGPGHERFPACGRGSRK